MMEARKRLRACCVLAAAVAMTGCGADVVRDVAGGWRASYGGRFAYVDIALQQEDEVLSGIACRGDSGKLIFSNAVVVGVYPNVTFRISDANAEPCCKRLVGTEFRGSFGDDGRLSGHFLLNGQEQGTELTFGRRATDATCSTERRGVGGRPTRR
jgi:hypothetical protein